MSDTVGEQDRFRRLEELAVTAYLQRRPFVAAQLGTRWSSEAVPIVGANREDDLIAALTGIRRSLRELSQHDLRLEDRLTERLMDEILGYEISSLHARTARYVVTPLPEAGLASQILLFLPQAKISCTDELEIYNSVCSKIPAVLKDGIEELSVGRALGQHPVAHLVRRAIGQIETYLALPVAKDPFIAATGLVAGDGTQGLRQRLTTTITGKVRPALAEYMSALGSLVLPGARADDQPGLKWLTGGEEIYRDRVREHTTLHIEPSHLHELALELVIQLQGDAVKTGVRLGWSRDFAWIRDRLRKDPDLYFRSPSEMIRKAETTLRNAEEQVPHWVCEPPTVSCCVREMTALEVRNGVLGRYQSAPLSRERPGWYWLNTSDPKTRPVYEAEVLAHHESVPGHHIEVSKSQETDTGSSFRQLVEITPFREGWALYMERYADEMGLYSDDVARLGMLSFALWRACRLVVDTGLHYFGWSRERAVLFMVNNTVLTRANIENEVDRYIACPGQALGYMVGSLAIGQFRLALTGSSSDPLTNRRFFTRLLAHGPLTLSCLAQELGASVNI